MYKTFLLICLASFGLLSDHHQTDDDLNPRDVKRIYPGEITLGTSNAPVTLIVYINYACTYCAEFEKAVLPALKTNFIATGKVKMVYRVFPMSGNLTGNSFLASEFAACGSQSGHFWEISNILFNHQGKNFWEHYEAWADALSPGFSTDVKSCMDFHKMRHHVATAQQRYAFHGIRVTPTVFIGGNKMEGLHSYEEYEKAITDLL